MLLLAPTLAEGSLKLAAILLEETWERSIAGLMIPASAYQRVREDDLVKRVVLAQ